MIGRRHYLGLALVLTAAISTAQVETRNTSIRYTSPIAGEEMYASYCAACHGDKGKGDGPAAAATATPPRDLTTLSKSNRGHFPRARVFFSILNGVPRQRGEQGYDMPNWKDPFYSLCVGQRGCDAEVQMRVVRLTDYLKSLQLK
jgi:mono/diheme cytochrome c family protein